LGRPGDSLASAQEAVRLAPYVWQTHYQLAMALRLGRRPRTADALAAVDEALRLAPHESQVHNLAGICLDELGRRDEAVRAYEESLRLDPTSAFAMNNLAADRLNRGKLAAASRMLTSGLSADPQQRFLHQNFDAILISLVSRLFVALMQFGILLGILAMGAVPYALRVAFVVAMLAVFGLLTWRVVRHLPRRSLRRARGLFRRSRAGRRALLVVFAVLTVCVVAVGLAPATIAVRIAEVVVGAMPILLLGVVVAWLLRAGLDLLRRR
jgi:tetratricopeptide (TPR) repeat protein